MNRKFTVLLLLSALTMADPAAAGPREGDASFTVNAGSFLFDKAERLDTGTLIGARLGYDLHRNVGIEGSFGFVDTRSKVSVSKPQARVYTYRTDVLYYLLPEAPVVPYLTAGGGVMTLNGSEIWGNRNSLLLNYGLGGKLFLSDTLAIRADARHLFSFDNNRHSHGEFTLGLNYYFSKGRTAVSKAAPLAEQESVPAKHYAAVPVAADRYVPAPVRAEKPLPAVQREEPPVTREESKPVIPPPPPVEKPAQAKPVEKSAAAVPLPQPVAVAAKPVAAVAALPVEGSLATASCGTTREVTRIVVGPNGFEILAPAGVGTYKVMTLGEPTRLSIDMDCATNGIGAKVLPVNHHGVTVVRLGSYPDKLRIVLDFAQQGVPRYKVEKSRQGLKVLLGNAATKS